MSEFRFMLARLLSRRGWRLGRALDIVYEVKFLARENRCNRVTIHEVDEVRCVTGFDR